MWATYLMCLLISYNFVAVKNQDADDFDEATTYYEATTTEEFTRELSTTEEFTSELSTTEEFATELSTTEESITEESYFETTTEEKLKEGEEKISDYILKLIDHFKQPDPVGLPGQTIPDPYEVPDIRHSLGFGTNLVFTDTAIHGISKFRVLYINTDMGNMECRAALLIDKIQTRGKYALNMWLNTYPGAFTSDVTGIKTTAIATLGVERDGKLRAQNISIDTTFKNIAVNFENAGFLASMLQGVFNSMSTFLFDSIKPFIMRDAYTNFREEINSKLDQFVGDIEFPNTISPLDMVIVDARRKMREMKMDPLKLEDHNTTAGIFTISLSNTWITGLTSFYRIGNISLRLENNTVVADVNIATQEIEGSTHWGISEFSTFMSRTGITSFSVEYIRSKIILAQALDTTKRMEFRDLELEVGNIQIHCDGAGTLDYIIELLANILPTLLRYQIIDGMRNPIKWKIQQELNEIDIEELIKYELPRVDEMQIKQFKLSDLKINRSADETYSDDEFFNF